MKTTHAEKRTHMLIMCMLITGCVSPYPVPVTEPSSEEINNVLNEDINEYQKMTTLAILYRDVWSNKSFGLVTQSNAFSELGFIGTVTALVAGVNGATTTAWAGGGVAAGSSILPQRYQYSAQAMNYRSAAEAANCIYDVVVKNGEFLRASNNINLFPGLLEEEKRYLGDITYELKKKQSDVKLLTPDLDTLKKALTGVSGRTNKNIDDAKVNQLINDMYVCKLAVTGK
ncbi:hypothetical protein [Brenneria uluponensis]|uniref:hypothetical protein n=1 Tax=Brenneria uluponensis TaxID=3057057 RepID=UPI0028E94AB5|nr:hypothetical protein [Brenneria ulupoensis]